MDRPRFLRLASVLAGSFLVLTAPAATSLQLPLTASDSLVLDGFYLEGSGGPTDLPDELFATPVPVGQTVTRTSAMPDGREIILTVERAADRTRVKLAMKPSEEGMQWGFALAAHADEFFTGLMERVVDGPQQASWAPGLTAALNLHGQKVAMLVKPTTSVYAPFYLSSRGYGLYVQSDWPGQYDFCATDPARVEVSFEGPALEFTVFTSRNPADLVRAHAQLAGPSILPPKWLFSPWRWRDEHKQQPVYYDGSAAPGPFNSQVMEDVLLMRAYGIPCGVYWIDRPWGPGRLGYDDFEIDEARLPRFAAMVRWLEDQGTKSMLWIGPFFQGRMETEALAKGYNLAGQPPLRNNYPMVDLTNPAARAYWQAGVARLLQLGVAGFKLDRGEEQIPESGPERTASGLSIRENRNSYVVRYVEAVAEVARRHRGDDFVAMPRGAYTGSSRHGVFWGGDIAGTQEGLRASIIAVQRAAVMGYPHWGSDTCGYNQQLLEPEVCGRWLAFSCFTPIMEVGPTRNRAFWDMPGEPHYNGGLIALWRLYARLHERLADYGYACAQEATRTGLPIVRPLFLVDPTAPAAWTHWQTYLYGPDLLVSPVWEKGVTEQEIYLPAGSRWRDAWEPAKVHDGGRVIKVATPPHRIPLFIRDGAAVGMAVGDLEKEYADAIAIAQTRPDLSALTAGAQAWFDRNGPAQP